MQKPQERLIVRRHDRLDCDIAAVLRIDELHADQIVFSRAIVDASGAVPARVVDCSQGGLGLRTPVYLPRGSRLVVTFRLADARDAPEHTLQLRVQRGSMLDRDPSYYIGTQLIEHPGAAEAIQALVQTAHGEQPHTSPDGDQA